MPETNNRNKKNFNFIYNSINNHKTHRNQSKNEV